MRGRVSLPLWAALSGGGGCRECPLPLLELGPWNWTDLAGTTQSDQTLGSGLWSLGARLRFSLRTVLRNSSSATPNFGYLMVISNVWGPETDTGTGHKAQHRRFRPYAPSTCPLQAQGLVTIIDLVFCRLRFEGREEKRKEREEQRTDRKAGKREEGQEASQPAAGKEPPFDQIYFPFRSECRGQEPKYLLLVLLPTCPLPQVAVPAPSPSPTPSPITPSPIWPASLSCTLSIGSTFFLGHHRTTVFYVPHLPVPHSSLPFRLGILSYFSGTSRFWSFSPAWWG